VQVSSDDLQIATIGRAVEGQPSADAARKLWNCTAGWTGCAACPAASGPPARRSTSGCARVRRKRTINALTSSGVARADAERIFELPSNVRLVVPHDDIAKGRPKLPSISSMLRAMGEPFQRRCWTAGPAQGVSTDPAPRWEPAKTNGE
jgi:hypothetical protein